ncbi:Pimeloyl-ACP methyl ester carboxylesterase [Mesobacillus persicus]|uniref:Pimeloyl-ACP methyl ester carboxylesterase n=1 Tax=Mesobacillus persicus TaxID=930146 RepID=A0A1H7ZQS6_9BACI|nr:alpha/beta hydrolase [Mesobacillus persicus]SEM61002.1 Pimeloyl-ACP methyl ester carboxylesterase [Mesobacillus persicus]
METTDFYGSKTINGVEIYYEHYDHPSSTETVVLIHGFLSSLFSFRHLVPLLKERFSIVSVDLPPFGRSGHSPMFKYSYKNIAYTVVKLLEELNIPKYHLIGHSMGGQIALNILYHYPNYAEKAILLCSSGYSKQAKRPLILASYLPFFHLFIKQYLARSGLEKNLKNVVYNQSLIDDKMRNGYLSPFLENRIFKGLTGLLRHREGDLPSSSLREIRTPCLLIWGDHDKVVPLEVGKRLATDLAHSELVVLKETGHLVPEERPNEVYQQIKTFIFG